MLLFVGDSRRGLRFTLQGRMEHNRIRHIIYHAAMRAHHVLKAERNSQRDVYKRQRFSFGYFNTEAEIDAAIAAVRRIAE